MLEPQEVALLIVNGSATVTLKTFAPIMLAYWREIVDALKRATNFKQEKSK